MAKSGVAFPTYGVPTWQKERGGIPLWPSPYGEGAYMAKREGGTAPMAIPLREGRPLRPMGASQREGALPDPPPLFGQRGLPLRP